jgi:hypothetical protein
MVDSVVHWQKSASFGKEHDHESHDHANRTSIKFSRRDIAPVLVNGNLMCIDEFLDCQPDALTK